MKRIIAPPLHIGIKPYLQYMPMNTGEYSIQCDRLKRFSTGQDGERTQMSTDHGNSESSSSENKRN